MTASSRGHARRWRISNILHSRKPLRVLRHMSARTSKEIELRSSVTDPASGVSRHGNAYGHWRHGLQTGIQRHVPSHWSVLLLQGERALNTTVSEALPSNTQGQVQSTSMNTTDIIMDDYAHPAIYSVDTSTMEARPSRLKLLIQNALLGDHPVCLLIDSGATQNMINTDLWNGA